MAIELKIPDVGESITEVMVGEWLKAEGDWVPRDEPLVVIETDKVNVEVPAPQAGILTKVLKKEGEDAEVGDVVGLMEAAEKPAGAPAGDAAVKEAAPAEPAAPQPATDAGAATAEPKVSPAARRALADAGVDATAVEATGRRGHVLKEDVQRHLAAGKQPSPSAPAAPPPVSTGGAREEETVRLTPLRRTIAERLVMAQQTAALLTTFNEIDMSAVMALRKRYREPFIEKHGIKLGFMSFFVKAAVEALKEVPRVNAEMRDDAIVYRNYQDIGVAVGGGKGLVVPVIRNAERLSFADVEKTIADLAGRARESKLSLDELQGGTFTISNGGVYGSLLSTPIINPPQSGILGLHKIEERPVAVNGEVVVRPMMYVALTYDHRIIDGREAVTFLVRIKERIEDPSRILLEV